MNWHATARSNEALIDGSVLQVKCGAVSQMSSPRLRPRPLTPSPQSTSFLNLVWVVGT